MSDPKQTMAAIRANNYTPPSQTQSAPTQYANSSAGANTVSDPREYMQQIRNAFSQLAAVQPSQSKIDSAKKSIVAYQDGKVSPWNTILNIANDLGKISQKNKGNDTEQEDQPDFSLTKNPSKVKQRDEELERRRKVDSYAEQGLPTQNIFGKEYVMGSVDPDVPKDNLWDYIVYNAKSFFDSGKRVTEGLPTPDKAAVSASKESTRAARELSKNYGIDTASIAGSKSAANAEAYLDEAANMSFGEKMGATAAGALVNYAPTMLNAGLTVADAVTGGRISSGKWGGDVAESIFGIAKFAAEGTNELTGIQADTIRKNTNWLGNLVLDIERTTVEQIVDRLLGAGIGGKVGRMIPFASRVFGATAQEGEDKGLDNVGQIALATARTGLEVGLEALGGFGGSWLGTGYGDRVFQLLDSWVARKTHSELLGTIAAAFGSEFLEETLADVGNPIIDRLFKISDGDESFLESVWGDGQILYDGLVGGIAGAMGTGGSYLSYGVQGKQLGVDITTYKAAERIATNKGLRDKFSEYTGIELSENEETAIAQIAVALTAVSDDGYTAHDAEQDLRADDATRYAEMYMRGAEADAAAEEEVRNGGRQPAASETPAKNGDDEWDVAWNIPAQETPTTPESTPITAPAEKPVAPKQTGKQLHESYADMESKFDSIDSFASKYAEDADKVKGVYAEGQDVKSFGNSFDEAYRLGESMLPESYLEGIQTLDSKQSKAAFELGRAAAGRRSEARTTNAARLSGKTAKGVVSGDGISLAEANKKFGGDSRVSVYRYFDAFTRSTGVNISLYSSEKSGDDGTLGEFSWANDTIRIDIDGTAFRNGDLKSITKYIMGSTLGHELTHFTEKWNAENYDSFRAFVFEELTRSGMDVHAEITARMESTGLSYDMASREVVAESMSDMLAQSDILERFAMRDANAAQRLLAKLKELTAKLKAYFKEISGTSTREAAALKSEIGYAEEMVKRWTDLLEGAIDRYNPAKSTAQKTEPKKTAPKKTAPKQEAAKTEVKTEEAKPLPKAETKTEPAATKSVEATTESTTKLPVKSTTSEYGYTVTDTAEAGIVEIKLPANAPESVAKEIKRKGFKWDAARGVWYGEGDAWLSEFDKAWGVETHRVITRKIDELYEYAKPENVVRRVKNSLKGKTLEQTIMNVAKRIPEADLPRLTDIAERIQIRTGMEDALKFIANSRNYSIPRLTRGKGKLLSLPTVQEPTHDNPAPPVDVEKANQIISELLADFKAYEAKFRGTIDLRKTGASLDTPGFYWAINKDMFSRFAAGMEAETLMRSGDPRAVELPAWTEVKNLIEEYRKAGAEAEAELEALVDEVAQREAFAPGSEGVVVDKSGEPVAMSTEEGLVQLSLKTYEDSGRSVFRKYLDKCVDTGRLTKQERKEMLDSIEEIYNICKEFKDKYAPFSSWSEAEVIRDTRGKPVFSVVTPNGDYKMNLDFSLVCKKRRALDAVLNEMAKRGILDDFELGQKSIVKINEMIRKHGFETACALCFVDAKRFRQAKVADDFVRLYNELVKSLVPEDQLGKIGHHNFAGNSTIKDAAGTIDSWEDQRLDFSHLRYVMNNYKSGTVEHKTAKYLMQHPEGRKLLARGDFMSSEAFDAVKTKSPAILKLYNAKKGTGGPKAAFGDVQYLNEIIGKARSWTPAKAYAVGGVRIQSFSDYVPRMVFDYVQMIHDLAALKLPAHAYTKEALFVKQFGLTGVKINMSLIPAIDKKGIAPGLDANGDYVWAGESFDFETAKEIQNAEGYSENCGTICVGVSDEHIRKLLADPDIRMVIPYHKSGINPVVAHMNQIADFKNYTDYQRTREMGDSGELSAVSKEFDFNKALHDMGTKGDPKAVAKQYLDWCAANGYTPKFDMFAREPNYYKLLEDFTLYDKDGKYVPQREVRPVFPKDGDAFGSMKGLIEAALEEDAVIEGRRMDSLGDIVDEIERSLPKTEAEIPETEVAQAEGDVESLVQTEENLVHKSKREELAREELLDALDALMSNAQIKWNHGNQIILTKSEYAAVSSRISTDYYRKRDGYFGIRAIDRSTDGKNAKHYVYLYIDKGFDDYEIIARMVYNRDDSLINIVRGVLDLGRTSKGISYGTGRIRAFVQRIAGNSVRGKNGSGNGTVRKATHTGTGQGTRANGRNGVGRINAASDGSGKQQESSEGADETLIQKSTARSDADYITYNRRAIVSGQTLNKWLFDYAAENPDYAQAYIAYMRPRDYLKLTTGGIADRLTVESQSEGLEVDEVIDYSKDQPIQLRIDSETGEIYGHEGRHRMVALESNGIEQVPVLLFDYNNKYSKVPIEQLRLQGQFDASALASISDVQPLSRGNRDAIVEKFGTKTTHEKMGEKYAGKETAQFATKRDTLSDTELLEMAAENLPRERMPKEQSAALDEFVKRLGRLRDLQSQREELGREYKEQRFTKGGDKAEAVKTKNRMDILDRKINALENTLIGMKNKEALKAVLREARRIAEQQQRAKSKSILEEYRAKRNESDAQKKYRDRVETTAKELMTWISSPSVKEGKRVPMELQEALRDFLSLIDFSSKRQLKGGEATKKDHAFYDRMLRVVEAVEANIKAVGQESGFADIRPEFTEEYRALAAKVRAMVGNGEVYIVNRMSGAELKELSKLLKEIKHYVSNMNTLAQNAMYTKATEAGDNTIQSVRKLGKAKKQGLVGRFLTWQHMRPAYVFSRFGKGGESIFEELQQGQSTQARLTKEVVDFSKKLFTSTQVKRWEKTTRTFDIGGEKVTIPLTHIMSIYCLSKRPQALTHLLGEGIRIASTKSGGKDIASTSHKLTGEDLAKIASTMDAFPAAKKVADEIQKYMSTVCAGWGNEVDMVRFGVPKFVEQFYFPVNSDGRRIPATANEAPAEASLYALLNANFTKSVVENAENRLIVYNIFDVFANHASDMIRYRSFALPVLDALKWFNHKGPDGTTVRDALAEAFGSGLDTKVGSGTKSFAEDFVLNLIKSFNGRDSSGDAWDSLGKEILGRHNRAQVGFTVRTIIQQPTSIVRAALVLPYDKLIKGLAVSAVQAEKLAEEMEKYSGIALWKSMGFYDVNITRSLTEMIKQDSTFLDKAADTGMKGAEFADRYTWAAMWYAAKNSVKRSKFDSEEKYFAAVTKIFEDAIYKTQVVDSVLTKSETQRAKGFFAKGMMSFMSEATATLSMLTDAVVQYDLDTRRMGKKEAWKSNRGRIGKILTIYAAAQALNAAATALIDAWRDDDEYETFWQKYADAFKKNLLDELNPLSKIPLVSDLYDWVINGFEPSNAMTQDSGYILKGAEILWKKANDAENYHYTTWGGIFNLMRGISGMLGVPIANLARESVDLWNHIADAAGKDDWKLKTYDPGVKNSIKYAYQDGFISADKAQALLVEEGVVETEDKDKAADEAYWIVQGWDGVNKYNTLREAALAMDENAFNEELEYLIEHGVFESTARSQITSLVGDAYLEGTMDSDRAMDMLTSFAGKEVWEAEEYILQKDFQKAWGQSYDSMKYLYCEGKMTAADVMYWRTYVGSSESSAEQWILNQDIYMLTGYESSSTGSSTYFDSYSQKEKMGTNSFWVNYGGMFRRPTDFGDLFNALDDSKNVDYPDLEYYNSYEGKMETVSATQRGIIYTLNDFIRRGIITPELAELVWTKRYGYSTNNKYAFQFVIQD